LSKDFVSRLNDALQLTPVQREVIAKIVADGQERNHELWTNVAPEMRKVMQDVRQQIRAELTPEQLKQFEELMKQHPPRRAPGTNTPPEVAAPTNPPSPGT
jgi:DNA-binding MarR family transcriptional regulator